MSGTKIHLGWFLAGFRAPAWMSKWSGRSTRDWAKGDFFVALAQTLERGCFDFIMIEDSNYIPDNYGGSHDVYLKHGHRGPKHDPLMLAAILTRETRNIGIVATVATTESTPFHIARTMATLDHLSDGRIGWNMVTGSNDRAAQNFGRPRQPLHDERYELADDFVTAAKALWDSWDPDAVILDEESGQYIDPEKVHVIDYEGPYFSTRGPLNTIPSPQGKPVLVQAGNSPRGQSFAGRHAEVVIAGGKSVEQMKAFRDSIRGVAAEQGRDPDSVKVLFLIDPVFGETDAEAKEKARRQREEHANDLEYVLSNWASTVTTDLSQFDPDEPLPKTLHTNGHQSQLDAMVNSGKTLRQIVTDSFADEDNGLVGTPADVARVMADTAEAVGGDGFLLSTRMPTLRYVSEVSDGLVPELQRLGVFRTEYEHPRFRDNLLAY